MRARSCSKAAVRAAILCAAFACLALLPAGAAHAATWPSLVATAPLSGFSLPTGIVAPDDGSGRLFVTEQGGLVRVVKDGAILPAPALDVSDLISRSNERGLLGIAFPPGFAAKRYAYIYFTNRAGSVYVSRIRMSASDPNRFDRATMQLILKVAHPLPIHNGGQMAFGPDGYLYIGIGDGGPQKDPLNRSQNLGILLGKILRIDTESTPNSPGYRVPRSNPFYGRRGRRAEIWAYGLRNPWRFSFDPATRDLWIGDVGLDTWEEIDRIPGGSKGGWNFGWSLYEGDAPFKAKRRLRGFAWPVMAFRHPEIEAIIGGYVYRGTANPGMYGLYFFGDVNTGRIWGLKQIDGVWTRQLLLTDRHIIDTFALDGAGELWFADFPLGTIYRIEEAPAAR
jgi:glucose/arabinose dehydrogenase